MVRLIAKSPFARQLPVEIAGITITEVAPDPVTSVAPYRGQEAAAGAALSVLGLGWPEPGQTQADGAARIVWAGRSMALLMGVRPPEGLEARAALVDQTGAFAMVALSGPAIDEVLARLVPVDLRLPVFPVGATRRTLIGHMTGSVTRTAEDTIEIAVMRSMGETLLHDLTRAIGVWSARP
ncbi:sarcosine oxidase subunit gamma [Ponticoccus sp. SC2-23]|uniref:sarcosine oxidase subunit gamma n=1 Tax=Alexandriicola marinus TaxID=2081710 RepID=UPI000FDBAF1E|nr:sarcosine oxidase subunit gamma family protein [Alexandriicola marinus]MBM1221236.1 sarcosine oxidase subunit gamma [Ponticoccus sp. SC6-9]MBM1225806.1 sarcosine oxidase subunit gamma [Ponticoccus sp. SC6-15]MBM1227958.1 sarcosine oxidase subunit gamma [Ponticoccus sp. SC6-38]MBM1234404.1 sarcosine oxidase subunit gamma [Ponticoccus sp. SC6-45]MBM1238460.1 sarcosine oxidase subunit gamma [Ponticoccus sp. SC6-49]MBM1243729.1 sarcosine oxidase subunit gamma [Ponticoccus sp. SC2-64]MBM124792